MNASVIQLITQDHNQRMNDAAFSQDVARIRTALASSHYENLLLEQRAAAVSDWMARNAPVEVDVPHPRAKNSRMILLRKNGDFIAFGRTLEDAVNNAIRMGMK